MTPSPPPVEGYLWTAFERFYRLEHDVVMGFALSYLGKDRVADAEDVVAETFTRAWREYCRELLVMNQVRGLLRKIALNVIRDEWRRNRRGLHFALSGDEPGESFDDWMTSLLPAHEDIAEDIASRDRIVAIWELLMAELPRSEMLVMFMTFRLDWDADKIATELGTTRATVYSLRLRAKRRIPALLENRADPLPPRTIRNPAGPRARRGVTTP